MIIKWHKNFQKSYQKRILPHKNIDSKFKERVIIFINNPQSSILKDHKLKGNKHKYRAFWIGGDLRVSYKKDGNIVEFMDIGSHNQVY
jgi:addiction module RelE/StbE family toxin